MGGGVVSAPYFRDYAEASAAARAAVRATGRAHGLEAWRSGLTPGARFRLFALPAPEYRSGYELRCEAFEVEAGRPPVGA